jgi:histidinol dehydrogenase
MAPTMGRRTLLRRQPLDEYEATAADTFAAEELFGERLTPDQVVAHPGDLRANGDQAVRKYSARIDGSALADFRVSPARIL